MSAFHLQVEQPEVVVLLPRVGDEGLVVFAASDEPYHRSQLDGLSDRDRAMARALLEVALRRLDEPIRVD